MPRPRLERDKYNAFKEVIIEEAIEAYRESGGYRDRLGEGEVRENAIKRLIKSTISYPYEIITFEVGDRRKQERRMSILKRMIAGEEKERILEDAKRCDVYDLAEGACDILADDNLEIAREIANDLKPNLSQDPEKLSIFAQALREELTKWIPIVCDKLSAELDRLDAEQVRKEGAKRQIEDAKKKAEEERIARSAPKLSAKRPRSGSDKSSSEESDAKVRRYEARQNGSEKPDTKSDTTKSEKSEKPDQGPSSSPLSPIDISRISHPDQVRATDEIGRFRR